MFPLKVNKKKTTFLLHIAKKNIQSIIPLNLFQTWCTLDLPPKMKENVDLLKQQNPEFKYYLYDDTMCREFIKENFDADVLYTFDKLKPGAYKADLWRYCILYKKGGIYLDIKYKCLSHFKLIELTNNEYCVKDRMYKGKIGIYNALLCFKRNNDLLYKCIQAIVQNVKYNLYGYSELYVTGPHLMSNFFDKKEILKLPLVFNGYYILFHDLPILIMYDNYREEQHKSTSIHYQKLWGDHNIYHYPTLDSTSCDITETLPVVIHSWYPLQFTINGTIETKPISNYFECIKSFFGYRNQDELWFILHKTQSFFAVFDVTMNLLRYSELFNCTKKDSKPWEYSKESFELLKWYKD